MFTRHESSGSVPLSIAISQGSAVVSMLCLTLTDQLKHNKIIHIGIYVIKCLK